MRFRRCVRLMGQLLMGGLFILVVVAGGTIGDRYLSAVAGPSEPTQLRPVARVERNRYASVNNLDVLLYPGVDADERAAVEEGFAFFSTEHTAEEGLGPAANQRF